MSVEELCSEIADGVEFWGYEENNELLGVMGLQQVKDVTLIRHALCSHIHEESGDWWQNEGGLAEETSTQEE